MFRTPLICREVGLALVWTCLFSASVAPVTAAEWEMYRQSATYMGTKWHVALYSQDAKTANAAFAKAWEMVDEIERDLTNYSATSELNRLCASSPHDHPVPVGRHLWTTLQASHRMSLKTDGAFDVTIGPVSKLWRRARKKKQMPDADKLTDALQAVGFRLIEYDQQTTAVRLTKPDMQLDLGGIAKGYAVDQALSVIRECGVTSALVNGGGDLAVSDPPPGKDAWQVEVAGLNPREQTRQIELANAAVATSGDAWQYLIIDKQRYSHIIDPRTGLGTTRRITASVVAPTCMLADALASACCVLDPTTSASLIKAHKDTAATIVSIGEDGSPRVLAIPATEP